jgi:AcrR family transcriptional regulator
MIAAVGRHGYHETTIAQVVEAAGLSRRTFYKYFDSKEACFEDTLRSIAAHLDQVAAEAGHGVEEWVPRLRAELDAVLAAFAENPDLARCALLTPAGSSAAIRDEYRAAVALVAERVESGRPAEIRPPSKLALEITVDGLIAIVSDVVKSGHGEQLQAMIDELHQFLLFPYLTDGEAGRADTEAEAE